MNLLTRKSSIVVAVCALGVLTWAQAAQAEDPTCCCPDRACRYDGCLETVCHIGGYGACRGIVSPCRVDGECTPVWQTAKCCLALGGTIGGGCGIEWMPADDAPQDTENSSPADDLSDGSEGDSASEKVSDEVVAEDVDSVSRAWLFALPALLFLTAVPAVLKRRRNT